LRPILAAAREQICGVVVVRPTKGPDLVYVMIADDIAAQIQDGRLVPCQRLPAENELATEYGVARMTVRRAMWELRERGLVRTVTGKGTFIERPAGR
jgi:GntR family transcriptional regulator